jgi:hypothetical protein
MRRKNKDCSLGFADALKSKITKSALVIEIFLLINSSNSSINKTIKEIGYLNIEILDSF